MISVVVCPASWVFLCSPMTPWFLWKTDTHPQTCSPLPIQPLRQTVTPSSAHTHTFSQSQGAYESSSHLCFYVVFISATVNTRHSGSSQRVRPAWKWADYPVISSIPTLVKSPADTQDNHVFCSSGTLVLAPAVRFVLQLDLYLR